MGFMKSGRRPIRVRVILVALLSTGLLPGGGAPFGGAAAVLDPRELFEQARAAYDAAQWRDAASQYETLLAAGYEDAAVFFNLGNAYFRLGDLPRAIACYRAAQYRRPRDPDIAANLRFAMERSGALPLITPAYQRVGHYLSATEWLALAYSAWGMLCVALALARLWTRRRQALLRLAALAGLVTLAAGGGWAEWHSLRRAPEAVVHVQEVSARFAPLEDAVVHFSVPAGTIVRLIGEDGTWRRIRAGGKSGWVREHELIPVAFR
ncbi:tetratricopeptide repeat protein [Thermosphaera sp.]